jgi:hypothetical protein
VRGVEDMKLDEAWQLFKNMPFPEVEMTGDRHLDALIDALLAYESLAAGRIDAVVSGGRVDPSDLAIPPELRDAIRQVKSTDQNPATAAVLEYAELITGLATRAQEVAARQPRRP